MGVFIIAQVQIDKKEAKTTVLKRVEAKNVCMGMGNNKLFEKELIPVVVDGKTYYGCCDGCVNKLSKDEGSRQAVDPVSGKIVDKATAVLGARPDGIVLYFENEENMGEYKLESLQLQ
ncbi:MAG: hypothetical protein IID16_02130 [Candidatus Marinimicrobia bacterium]|nr:hypothetical protein [Candidatus Neomarinimicrobiota bacterium]